MKKLSVICFLITTLAVGSIAIGQQDANEFQRHQYACCMSAFKKIVLAVSGATFAFSQSAPNPQFEVASIRPAQAWDGQQAHLQIDGAHVRLDSLRLKDYISTAYSIKPDQIFGPDWTGSDRYDLQATIPAGSSRDQLPQMFQELLADRFALKFHREKREFPVYVLTLGKGPLKVREALDRAGDSPAPVPVSGGSSGSANGIYVNLGNGSSWSFVPNRFEVHKLTMEVFVTFLQRFTDRTIVDMTGLKGQYDLSFDVNPEDYQSMMIRNSIAVGVSVSPQALKVLESSSSAPLSDALEKIGLKLDARKAPLDVIVVDSARRTPTEN